MMKIDGIPVWILKLLPTEDLGTANVSCLLQHDHLYQTRNIARLSDAHDAKHGVRAFEYDQVLDSICLRWFSASSASEAEESKSRLLVHLGVVGCSIERIRPTARLEEAIDKVIWDPQRT